MPIKLNSLKADTKRESEGEWIKARPMIVKGEMTDFPDVEFRVRSTDYPPFVSARNAAMIQLQKKYGVEDVPQDEAAKVDGKLAVKHLLLEWKGFDVPYSEEVAIEALTDEEHRTLRDLVYRAAARVGASQIEFVEAAAKNSEAPSGTN